MNPRSKAPPRPGTRNKLIMALIAVSWICGGALLKINAPWLYLLIAISVTAALWVGRRQGWLLRAVVLLALAIPISKIVQERPPKGDLHENTPTTFTSTSEKRDGAVIRALVAAEETYLNLSPKMNILSRGLLDLRLPGPTADAESVFSTTVTTVDLDPAPAAAPTDSSKFEAHPWPVAALSRQTEGVDLWRPMLDKIS